MKIDKLIIAGPRHLERTTHVAEAIEFFGLEPTSIISGGARGIDESAVEYARANRIVFGIVRADWEQYGKAAGPIRNRVMVKHGRAALVVWDGNSRGSADMIKAAVENGMPVFVWPAKRRVDGSQATTEGPAGPQA